MRKALFGFVAGVVASVLVFLLVLHVEQESDTDGFDPETHSSSEDGTEPGRRSDPQITPPERRPDGPSPAGESQEVLLRRQIEEARQFIVDATRELEQRELQRITEQPIAQSLPLPAELGWVTQDPDRALFYELIQREYRDDGWANPMEARLQALIYSRPEIVRALGPPTITCRATRCQVTFANGGANESARDAFGVLSAEWQSSDVRDEFGMVPGTFWVEQRYEDGVAGVFWSLPRRDE